MRRLLLLLPLVVVAARMQIEWLWFDQFNLANDVLLERWLLQLLLAGVAMLPLLAAIGPGPDNSDNRSVTSSQGISLRGWPYGIALLISAGVVLISALLTLDLLALAIRDPFQLGIGSQTLWPHNRIGSVVKLVQAFGGIGLAMAWLRLRPWLGRIVAASWVVVVSRAWGIWSLALWIPDAIHERPLARNGFELRLGAFCRSASGPGTAALGRRVHPRV